MVLGLSRQFGVRWRPDASHRWLVRFLADKPGVEYVDIVAVFRDWYLHHDGKLYLDRDGHTNAEGHRLIGKTVLEALRKDHPTVKTP